MTKQKPYPTFIGVSWFAWLFAIMTSIFLGCGCAAMSDGSYSKGLPMAFMGLFLGITLWHIVLWEKLGI